jgi:LysM repeat protein
MIWATALLRTGMIIVLVGLGCGCGNLFRTSSDEQKDPHYLTGKNRLTSLDFKGASDAFEQALEANPRSASAHFELGFLYEQKLTNYAAAIYHFEQFLNLRPQSEHAEFIRQHIIASKQELARTVPMGPTTPTMQRDLARLAEENLRLRQQIDLLNRRVAELTNAVQTAMSTSPPPLTPTAPAAPHTTAPSVATPPPAAGASNTSSITREATAPAPTTTPVAASRASAKSYTVQRGDTMAQIARKQGVKLTSLQEANPRVDSRRLRPGQVLVIPAK